MVTAAIILVVFMATAYCSKNYDGTGSESRGIGFFEEIKLMYCFDAEGYNTRGFNKYGYDRNGINEFGYDKFGNKR